MTAVQMAVRLQRRGVNVRIRNGHLEVKGDLEAAEREFVLTHRAEFVLVVELAQVEGLDEGIDAGRARAFWLCRIAREGGLDADQLFNRIDVVFGHRTLGPFELTLDDVLRLALELKSEVGSRPAIESTTPTSADRIDTTVPASISRKIELAWTDARFSSLCQRLLGHPGLRSAEDDRRVLAAMDQHAGGRRP